MLSRPRPWAHQSARRSRWPRVRTASGSACGPSCWQSNDDRPRCETARSDCRWPWRARPRPAARRCAGPRGPSSVNAAGLPAAMSRFSLHERLHRAARRRSARSPVAEALDDAGDPLAVEVLAGDDDDAAAAEVDGGGENAAVPERHDRLAAAVDDLSGSARCLPRASGSVDAERRDDRIAGGRDQRRLKALRTRRAPGLGVRSSQLASW